MPLPTQLLHSRNRLPKITPAINLEQGRFFISRKEFDLRVNTIVKDLQKIIDFALFVRLKKKIVERDLIYGDRDIFSIFLFEFTIREFIDRRNLFRKLCGQYSFEFLILFDLLRE